ncbi:FAD-binding oxidoreductase [Psychromarinibacter sp. C21-152]|uniref:FAD-binding oxidoreductase n=1 Tax=Psychromarinibacter sediminicola TaxID=3033385 RepID=A0AAE3T8I8_9RHOB|nr:FAD-binding oxidoreductase [Psychromarinibacter sediminicola]MDF0600758.1 FAD-binding oxidoreductase [Psychromarinibacter sediminicola]
MRQGDVSFWYADIGGVPARRAPMQGDTRADICIVGAGYTGLWTAYYLKQADQSLDVLVVEKDFAGFGASGRNGGWLTGGFAWTHDRYRAAAGEAGVRAMVRAMNGTVDEVIRVAEAEGIDADILRTDELVYAVNDAQQRRLEDEAETRIRWGEEGRVRTIGAEEARARVDVPGTRGAMVVGGVARVQPAKLVRGLAAAAERLGVRIVEGTAVTSIAPGRVDTDRGRVTAPVILRATEGFTATLPGSERDWLPLNSAQIVTEPLPDAVWDRIGWHGHEIVGDFSHVYCYCQRTREGRIAVGGRGMPYRYGSGLDDNGRPGGDTVARLMRILRRHFPAAAEARIDHAWCGVLGVPRDWCATVGFDRDTGIGWAGGYVGVGVSTSNLAGRTLADLARGQETELTGLPWVNRRVRRWEPEPLRWLGITGMYRLLDAADRHEARGGGPSRLAALGYRLTGR